MVPMCAADQVSVTVSDPPVADASANAAMDRFGLDVVPIWVNELPVVATGNPPEPPHTSPPTTRSPAVGAASVNGCGATAEEKGFAAGTAPSGVAVAPRC